MSDASERIYWDEAVAEIMRRSGKTRRQANAWLEEAMRQGKLRGFVENPKTGEVIDISKDADPSP